MGAVKLFTIFISLLLLTTSFQTSAATRNSLGLGAGMYSQEEGKINEDKTKQSATNPYVYLSGRLLLSKKLRLLPEFGYVFPQTGDSIKWYHLFVNLNGGYALSRQFQLIAGPGVLIRNISPTGDGGAEKLSGLGGTVYHPSNSSSLTQFTTNFGAEILINQFSLKGELIIVRALSETRKLNFAISGSYHL